MKEPVSGRDYSDRETEAVHAVLIELAQILGAQNGMFVLVGGSVPGILLKGALPRHIGTMDIDIELNPQVLGEYGYVDMVEELERHGYERQVQGLKPFQMQREISIGQGAKMAVIIDLLMPKNATVTRRDQSIVDGLRVLRIDGGDVAINHAERMTLRGIMPCGIHNEVEILVASIPALLVMKGYALGNRMKGKDAYDIWYSIRHYADGVEALAERCRAIIGEPGVREGYQFIAQKFSALDTYGPQMVRQFLAERPDQLEMELDQLQNDAFLRVNRWCRLTGLLET